MAFLNPQILGSIQPADTFKYFFYIVNPHKFLAGTATANGGSLVVGEPYVL